MLHMQHVLYITYMCKEFVITRSLGFVTKIDYVKVTVLITAH